jgi:predicted NBD/HSP70 family sugar kinase
MIENARQVLVIDIGGTNVKFLGKKKWQRHVEEIVGRLAAALKPDDLVIGGGNAKKLDPLPAGARRGDNANAFLGGFRLWEGEADRPRAFAWNTSSVSPSSVSPNSVSPNRVSPAPLDGRAEAKSPPRSRRRT